MAERFSTVTEADEQRILHEKNAANTHKATAIAWGTLTTYCTVTGIRFDIATVTPNELDAILKKFYLELRKQDGNLYKKTTFRAIRNGIQRKLMTEGRPTDRYS